jgi:hypothetical protein
MDPITGLAIGTTVFNLGASLFGKSQQAKAQRKYNRWLDGQQTKLDAWYNQEKNTKYMDTAEGQSTYNGLRRLLRENDQRVDNTLVKTGATTEAKLAQKEKAQETMASATSQMAAQDTVRKQNLTNQYQNQSNSLRAMRAGNMQGSISGASNTADNAMGALSGGLQTIFTGLASAKKPNAATGQTIESNNNEQLLA